LYDSKAERYLQVFPDGRGLIIDMGTALPLCGEIINCRDPFEIVSKIPVPEIVGKYGTYSEQSDIFHFGILLWDTAKLMKPEVLRSADQRFITQFENLVRDCVQFEPRRRPESMESVLKKLDSMLMILRNDRMPSSVVSFHEACERGHIGQVLEHLGTLKETDVMNQKNCIGETPLILAMGNGHALIAKELLQHGARLDIKNSIGKTALDQAFFQGRREVVDLILTMKSTSITAPELLLLCCNHVSFLDILERLILVPDIDINF